MAILKDDMMRRKTFLFLAILVAALLMTACSSIGAGSSARAPFDSYDIDPIFWGFFQEHGGSDQFGPVLSTVFTNAAGEKLQYVESGLLVYTPNEDRHYFAPLGVDLNLATPPDPSQQQVGGLVINGYEIHPALIQLYIDLGREIVGAPISNPNYNYAKNRLEQHFENLGLYYLLDDPDQIPHLLSYGLLACETCQAYPTLESSSIQGPITDDLFRDFITANGIPADLLGDLIEGPVLLSGSTAEMVFDNMVLSTQDGRIYIQALPQAMGLSSDALFVPIESPLLTFVHIRDGLGHNVLTQFQAFIDDHGGYAVCGYPTTELFPADAENSAIRQCFTYLCLDYIPDALEANVRPAQLGLEYLNAFAESNPGENLALPYDSTAPRSSALFTLSAWERFSTINSVTPQTISAMVFSHGVAQSRQNLELYLTFPDGSRQLYYLPTTNEEGRTGITIQPIVGENGTMIPYQVCLSIEGQEPICIKKSFRIWGNP